MIVSKPKRNALFAIGLFVLISFSLGFINLNIIIQGGARWYSFLIVFTILPLALIILIRQLAGYKIITINKDTIKVAHPFILQGYGFKVKEITGWEETIIKTKNGFYKELSIRTDTANLLKLTLQENSNYEKVKDFLQKKAAGKKMK